MASGLVDRAALRVLRADETLMDALRAAMQRPVVHLCPGCSLDAQGPLGLCAACVHERRTQAA